MIFILKINYTVFLRIDEKLKDKKKSTALYDTLIPLGRVTDCTFLTHIFMNRKYTELDE